MSTSKRAIVGLAMVLGCAVMAAPAWADVSYSYVGLPGSTSVVGGPASVSIYLKETLSGASTSLINGDEGVSGAGFKVSLSSGDGAKITGISFNSAFNNTDLQSSSFSDSEASLLENAMASVIADGSGLVLLGTVTLAGSGSGSGPAVFAVQRYDNLGGNTITANNVYDLDFNSTTPAFSGASGQTTFTVLVPEPGTMGLLGVAGALVLRRKR